MTEAEDLSGLLKAGSLPAPARIVDEVGITTAWSRKH